jgi:hypothetical protein
MEWFFEDYFERLQTLHKDFIATFEDLPAEALDWKPAADMNSFGVLVAHTMGASRFWVGDAGLNDPSNRNRPAEFQTSGLSADELKRRITALESYVRAGLEPLTLANLADMHTIRHPQGHMIDLTTARALLQALDHTGLHLGHAQITRQLWQMR